MCLRCPDYITRLWLPLPVPSISITSSPIVCISLPCPCSRSSDKLCDALYVGVPVLYNSCATVSTVNLASASDSWDLLTRARSLAADSFLLAGPLALEMLISRVLTLGCSLDFSLVGIESPAFGLLAMGVFSILIAMAGEILFETVCTLDWPVEGL